MPRIEELIDKLGGGATYLTMLNLARGYWQVPMAENAKENTAFIMLHGLFQFEVMPFRLNGAPATFQHLWTELSRGWRSKLLYIWMI